MSGAGLWAALLLGVTVLHAAAPVALSGRAMGTTWAVKFVAPATPVDTASVERAVVERLEMLEGLFSTYRTTSALMWFNAVQSTDWFPVAPELAQVANESRRISALTDGAFDVTVFPLVQLWGFGPAGRAASPPTAQEIGAARARVDWRRLEVRLDPAALRKTEPSVTLDLSSLAKGFSSDAVSELLDRMGVSNHLVQIGGDIRTSGNGLDGSGWRMAIESPARDQPGLAQIVALAGNALSTSGDYRNSFVVATRRYGHIIDPRNGEPVSGDLAAVSVVDDACARSSALATALFVLGAEEGYRLASRERIAALFQVRQGKKILLRATPEFARWRR